MGNTATKPDFYTVNSEWVKDDQNFTKMEYFGIYDLIAGLLLWVTIFTIMIIVVIYVCKCMKAVTKLSEPKHT
jgi:uncharacterized membrane protein